MSKLSKESLDKLRQSVNYTRQVPKARGTRGYRRMRPGQDAAKYVQLTAVNEDIDEGFPYSYRAVQYNWDDDVWEVADGIEGDDAQCLPMPTPFCRLGDIVKLTEIEGHYFFEYPTFNPVRYGTIANDHTFGSFSYLYQEDDEDTAVKLFLRSYKATEATEGGLPANWRNGWTTPQLKDDEGRAKEKVYVFNQFFDSIQGGASITFSWNGCCWVASSWICGDS